MHVDERYVAIDQIKGLSILGVIYIHCYPLIKGAGLIGEVTLALSRLAVPIFLFFYCFFLEKSVSRRGSTVYKDRLYAISSCYLVWTIVYFLVNADFSLLYLEPHKLLTGYWWGYGWSGQYFFLILIQLTVIFPALRRLSRWKHSEIILALVTGAIYIYLSYYGVGGVIYKLGSMPVVYWLSYSVLGIQLAGTNTPPIDSATKYSMIRVIICFISVVLIPVELITYGLNAHFPYMFVSLLFAVHLLLPMLYNKFTVSKCNLKNLSLFGKNSLALFVMNPMLVHFSALLLHGPVTVNSAVIGYVMLISITFVLAWLIIVVLPFLRRTNLRYVLQ